jgi:hypothetical protein
MGYAAVRWFDKGQKLSADALKKLTQVVTTYLLGTLKNIGKRKPGQRGLQHRVAQSLEDLPLVESQAALDSEAGE